MPVSITQTRDPSTTAKQPRLTRSMPSSSVCGVQAVWSEPGNITDGSAWNHPSSIAYRVMLPTGMLQITDG